MFGFNLQTLTTDKFNKFTSLQFTDSPGPQKETADKLNLLFRYLMRDEGNKTARQRKVFQPLLGFLEDSQWEV